MFSQSKVGLSFLRTEIRFNKIFGKELIFGRPAGEILKPIHIEFKEGDLVKASGPKPAFELLYLDSDLRVQQTSQGYTFIIAKDYNVDTGSGNGGVGPWLSKRIGEKGMKALGVVSVVPYMLFIYKFLDSLF